MCVYSVWLCVYPDTGFLCSPAGQLIRSYSHNQLSFTSLSRSLSLSFSLLIHFVWPGAPSLPPPPSEWTAWNNPASLPDWQITVGLWFQSWHWYPFTDMHQGRSVTVIPLMTPLESLTPSQDVLLPLEIISAHETRSDAEENLNRAA